MTFSYTDITTALILSVAVYNLLKLGCNMLLERQSVLTPKVTRSQVKFSNTTKNSAEKKAKEEFDAIMAIPAYARKEMNINYFGDIFPNETSCDKVDLSIDEVETASYEVDHSEPSFQFDDDYEAAYAEWQCANS